MKVIPYFSVLEPSITQLVQLTTSYLLICVTVNTSRSVKRDVTQKNEKFLISLRYGKLDPGTHSDLGMYLLGYFGTFIMIV